MIIGKIDEISQENLLSNIEEINNLFKYIKNTKLYDLKTNRIKVDDSIFAFNLIYETKALSESNWEAHRKYLDFHYILEGEEKIVINSVNNMKIKDEYDEENDVLIGKVNEPNIEINLKKGMYVIIFPEEAHLAGISTNNHFKNVHKIVFKIPMIKK